MWMSRVVTQDFAPTVRSSKLSDADKRSEWARRIDPTLKEKRILAELK